MKISILLNQLTPLLAYLIQKVYKMSKAKGITLKFIVIGDSGVGKTNLLVRYCQDTFHNDYLSTIGVDFKIKRFQHDGQLITLNIWDTAGQERFRNITKSFYKGAHGIILTYSITDPPSYSHIESWIDQIKQSGNSNMKMILVATKCDMQSDRKVSKDQGYKLAQKYGIDFIETSAKDDINVSEVFKKLTATILASQILQIKQQQHKVNLQQKDQQKKQKKQCCN